MQGLWVKPRQESVSIREKLWKILEVLLLPPATSNVVLHALTLGGKALMMSKQLMRRDISTV